MEVFDTHKFLYSLNYDRGLEGLTVIYLDNNGEKKEIKVKSGEIGNTPVSCRLYDENGERYIVAYAKIIKIYDNGELAWDPGEPDQSSINVVEGYKKRERKGEL